MNLKFAYNFLSTRLRSTTAFKHQIYISVFTKIFKRTNIRRLCYEILTIKREKRRLVEVHYDLCKCFYLLLLLLQGNI